MTHLQIINVIINQLITGPKPAWAIADHLLRLNFDSTQIFDVLQALAESKQVLTNSKWELFLNPAVESSEEPSS